MHIIDETKISDKKFLEEFSDAAGVYSLTNQFIAIFYQKTIQKKGLLYFAQAITHEILHFNSFSSLNKAKEKETVRKMGLEITSDKRYFNKLYEALIEELSKRFEKLYFKDILILKKYLEEKDNENDPDLAYKVFQTVKLPDDSYKTTTAKIPYAYKKYRLRLDEIIEGIQKKFPDKFNLKEDVFKVFVKACFSGNSVEIARLIEGTYGKGSFRKIAEETSIELKPQ